MTLRVLICGSRTWDDKHSISTVLRGLRSLADEQETTLEVVHGAALGADSLADEFGRLHAHRVIPVPADWKTHGRAAGPIRNQRMIDEYQPNIVYAFRCAGTSRGTDDMIQRSRNHEIPVFIIRKED